jgi:peptide deformylase
MALRKILTQGDPVLGKVCHPVTRFDEKLHALLDDMQETLADAQGYGLAAPQVGILRRVVLVTASDGKVLELVNPEIVLTEGEQTDLEGCLSVPGLYGNVTRPARVRVRAQDRNGKVFEVEDVEMTARCFCHECEHLDGHLFTEHTDRLYTVQELEEMEKDD